jgi:pectinacetylesterase
MKTRVLHRAMWLASGWLATACGSSNAGNAVDAGPDSQMSIDAAQDVGASDTGPAEAESDAPDTTPITDLPTETWTWVAFPDAKCRDASSTGIGVSLNPASKKLMIFMEGGGSCFDVTSCGTNASHFGEADFSARAVSSADYLGLNVGILDRTKAANPVKDWSYVYIPYCTGDSHMGNNVATVAGVGVQQFMGYVDMGQYLDRIVPTFASVTQVLLTGLSAGGLGAAANYHQTARAFGSTPVDLIDDSGPFLESPYGAIPTATWTLFGLDATVGADCGSHCPNPGSFGVDYAKYLVASYPDATFGLADSTNDGATNPMFEAGLLDIRAKLAPYPNFGEFIFAGTDHTSIQRAVFYTRTAGGGDGGAEGGAGMLMTDWVKDLLNGTATNPGP